MSPADLKVAERLAKNTNRSISGVLREGLKRPKAEALGITENDVVRLVKEYRREKRASNAKNNTK